MFLIEMRFENYCSLDLDFRNLSSYLYGLDNINYFPKNYIWIYCFIYFNEALPNTQKEFRFFKK